MKHTVEFLSKEEEIALARLALAGDDEARNRVVMGIYPWILNRAKVYARSKRTPYDDLVQHALTACIEKFHLLNLDDFDTRPMTYFTNVAERQMQLLTKIDGVIKGPASIPDFRSDETKRQAEMTRRVASFSMPTGNRNSKDASRLGDSLSANEPEPHEVSIDNENGLQFEAWLRWLPDERMRTVMRSRIVEGASLSEVGNRIGVSKERIRQIETKAMDIIERGITSNRPIPPPDSKDESPMILPITAREDLTVRNLLTKTCAFCTREFKTYIEKQECCSRSCSQRKINGHTFDPATQVSPGAYAEKIAAQNGVAQVAPAEPPRKRGRPIGTNGKHEKPRESSLIEALEKELEAKKAEVPLLRRA